MEPPRDLVTNPKVTVPHRINAFPWIYSICNRARPSNSGGNSPITWLWSSQSTLGLASLPNADGSHAEGHLDETPGYVAMSGEGLRDARALRR